MFGVISSERRIKIDVLLLTFCELNVYIYRNKSCFPCDNAMPAQHLTPLLGHQKRHVVAGCLGSIRTPVQRISAVVSNLSSTFTAVQWEDRAITTS